MNSSVLLLNLSFERWLIDHSKDAEGLRVIADLHGAGNANSEVVRAEYQEIRNKVLEEVRTGVI